MIPINESKGQGCNPISSNCVIWQGPDIECINLCKGDSISDVTAKLAEELCELLCDLDIKTYDLACFEPICPTPESFHDLIQFLVTKLCELQCCCDADSTSTSSVCPDTCVVTVAPCFYYVNNIGDTISTMTLTEYAQAIGNKLCTLVSEISTTGARLTTVEDTTAAIGSRVATLEEEIVDAVVTLPTSCLLGPPPTAEGWPIATIVQNTETELCNLEVATGTPIKLLQAIQKQCINIDNTRQLANRFSNMGSITGWVTAGSYATVADSLNNMWLAICDIRAAVENILLTCCCTDCDDVNISFTATIEGDTLSLFFVGTIPTGLTDCFPSGNLITITDANGGSYSTYVQVVNNVNGTVTISLASTPVNTATDLTIIVQGCWNRPSPGTDCGGLRCERMLTYTIVNTAPCPDPFTVTPDVDSIEYSFTSNVEGSVTYTIELYTGAGVFVASDTQANPAQFSTVDGEFTDLICDSSYYILVKVIIAGNTLVCPQTFVTTEPCPCAAATAVSASKTAP